MNIKDFKSFSCGTCGGSVCLSGGKSRTRLIEKNVERLIPDDFLLPTCLDCGEIYYSIEFTDPLDKILREGKS